MNGRAVPFADIDALLRRARYNAINQELTALTRQFWAGYVKALEDARGGVGARAADIDAQHALEPHKLPHANGNKHYTHKLSEHTADARFAVVAGDLQVNQHAHLQRMVHPLADTEQQSAQADQQHDLIRDLQGDRQRQDENGHSHPNDQLVPIVEHKRFQPLHRAPLQVGDINDPRLTDLIAAARDGTGSPLDLVGINVEPLLAPAPCASRLRRFATWMRERIAVWLLAAAVAVCIARAPVIDDGAEAVAADVQDAQAQAVATAKLARSEP